MKENPYFTIEQVADGVYAALATDMTDALGNAVIVNLGDHALVFDTFASNAAGEQLERAVRGLTRRHARWIVNSHHHGDHVFGNWAFIESGPIISTHQTREEIIKLGNLVGHHLTTTNQELEMLRALSKTKQEEKSQEISDLENRLSYLDNRLLGMPTLLFQEKLTLLDINHTAEIITLGGGHTVSDSFIYLPEARTLLLADLFFQGEHHPWVGDGNPVEWVRILEEILTYPADKFVPGHGKVGGRADVEKFLAYMRDFADIVEQKRQSPDMEIHIPEQYASWEGPEWFEQSIAKLTEETPTQ